MRFKEQASGLTILGYYSAGIIAVALVILATHTVLSPNPFISLQFHAFIEASGSLAALALAGLLHMQPARTSRPYFPLIQCSMLGMGLLDLFHSISVIGDNFVWLHSIATLVGGLFISLVWMPERLFRSTMFAALPKAAIFSALLLGVMATIFPQTVPAMVKKGAFTAAAQLVNSLGGMLCLMASAWFYLSYWQYRRRFDEILFANFFLLLGVAGIYFSFSSLWDLEWWIWHGIRLFAHGLAVAYIYVTLRRLESARRETEDRYRRLTENSPDLAYIFSDRRGGLYYSQRSTEILGYSPEELLRNPFLWHDSIHPEDLPAVDAVIRAAAKGGGHEHVEYRIKDRHGGWHWFLDRFIGRSTEGDEIFIEGLASDITGRKLAEQELMQLSARNEALLAAVPDIIMEVDVNKIYTWANPAGFAFFGDDVIGREAADYFVGEQHTYDIVHPMFQGESGLFYVESWQRRRDGETRLLAWWCRSFKDASGVVTGALSSARDITGQRLAEKEQIRMRQRLEAQWDMVQMADADEKALCDRALLHIVATLTGSRYGFYGHIDEGESMMRAWSREVMADSGVYNKPLDFPFEKAGVWANAIRERRTLIINDLTGEHPFKKGLPEAHVTIKRIMVVPVFKAGRIVAVGAVANKAGEYTEAEAGEVREFLHSVQLLIDNRRGEEALRRSMETQAVLLREVNHRVKNNLTVIISLLHKEEDRARQKGLTGAQPMLRDLHDRIASLLIVHGMLSSSDWRDINLGELCKNLVAGLVRSRSGDTALKITATDIAVNSDQAHYLALMLNELTTNSLKYAAAISARPEIGIAFARDNHNLEIVYRDNGPGYPEPIIKGNYTESTIGFELIQGIVRQSLRGSVSFRNENGAVAEIVFPA